MKKTLLAAIIGVSLILTSAALDAHQRDLGSDGERAQNTDPATEKRIHAKLPALRLPFIKNEYQTDKRVKYYAKTFTGTVFVSDEEITYALPGTKKTERKGWVIKEKLIHAKKMKALGKGETGTRINSFKGNDPEKWRRNVPTFHSVHLGEVYEGIELELKAYGSNVEKVFTVGRGADPEKIRIQVQGADSLYVNDKGELEMETGLGTVRMTAPVAYQEINGKTFNVMASYSMKGQNSKCEYGFKLGAYNKGHPVIIDPLLASTFIGGGDSDWCYSIALDQSGNVYVTGYTNSSDYPTTVGAYDESYNSSNNTGDVFISKLDSDLSSNPSIIHSFVVPENTTVPQGGILGPFQASVTNDTGEFSVFHVAPYLVGPTGDRFMMFWREFGLDSGDTSLSHDIYLRVPLIAKPGTHYNCVDVYDTSMNLINQDWFTFEVTARSAKLKGSGNILSVKKLMNTPGAHVTERNGWKMIFVPRNR